MITNSELFLLGRPMCLVPSLGNRPTTVARTCRGHRRYRSRSSPPFSPPSSRENAMLKVRKLDPVCEGGPSFGRPQSVPCLLLPSRKLDPASESPPRTTPSALTQTPSLSRPPPPRSHKRAAAAWTTEGGRAEVSPSFPLS